MLLYPYALLQASKPQPSPITPYDLYSLSQTDAARTSGTEAHQNAPVQHEQTAPSQPPAKRTHYIADIHARHTNAMHRTPQSPSSL